MMYRIVSLLIGIMVVAHIGPAQASTSPHPGAATTFTPVSHAVVLRVRAATFAEARELVLSGVDVLGRDGDDLFILAGPATQARLLADGWHIRLDAAQTEMLQQANTLANHEAYQTVEEVETFLSTMAARYPHLSKLVVFGESWERQQVAGNGYDLLALRLTNQNTPGPKPVFFLMGAIHARELVTAEIATRFIEYLLTNYGTDPDVTWVLNEHEIVVAPLVNPDGHKVAEQGYMQRKNTNTSFGGNCHAPPTASSNYGVDLNRNFSYQWGLLSRPDMDPCNVTFPGNAPASEPETAAIEAFIRSLYPDHPRPASGTPAPADTSGVLISMHSYADLIVWPWGSTTNPAPNGAGLARLGQRLARFSGYTAGQAVTLYPTAGTTDDWAYAELGIAAYTFEIGPAYGDCGGFMPPFRCLDSGDDGQFWQRNLPALFYAAQVARAPYTQPAGPEVAYVEVGADVVSSTIPITPGTLTRTRLVSTTNPTTSTRALDLAVGFDAQGEPATAAEIYLEDSPWQGGEAYPLPAPDNPTTPDSPWMLSLTFDTTEPAEPTPAAQQEQQLLLVRGRSAEGVWGPLQAVWVPGDVVLPSGPDPLPAHLWLPLVAK